MTPLNAVTLKEGFDQFNAPRQEGEIDLIESVRQSLTKALTDTGRSLVGYDADPLIIEAKNKQCHIQRWFLNRYWTRQLACSTSNTMHVRRYLINDGTEEEWNRLFIQNVLPFVVENNLPAII